ncbi:hypothetical protein D9M71_620870 [compost metagenome]
MRRAAHGIKRMVVIVGNHVRRNGLAVGNQRHVPAHRGFTGEAVFVDGGGKTGAEGANVFRVHPVVLADLASAEVRRTGGGFEIQLGCLVVILDRVQAVLDRLGAVLQLQATLPRTFRFLVIAMEERRRAAGIATEESRKWRAHDQAFVAFTNGVTGGKVTAGTRQACLFPLQLVKGAE